MKNFSLLFMLFILISASAANSSVIVQDDWQSRDYTVKAFKYLHLRGTFRVKLIQGDHNSLSVRTTDSKAFDYLTINNEGDDLYIKVKREPFDFSRVTLYITFKDLEKLEIGGGMNLETEGYLDLDDLSVRVEGGARIKFLTKAKDIKIRSEGGVLFNLSGVSRSLDVRLAGAGHVNAGDLKAKDVSFVIEGVGTGLVHATHSLDAELKGVGKLTYRCNPRVTKIVEGLGSVKKE